MQISRSVDEITRLILLRSVTSLKHIGMPSIGDLPGCIDVIVFFLFNYQRYLPVFALLYPAIVSL